MTCYANPVTHACTEDQLVEQPSIGSFAELGWRHRRTRDLLLPRLPSEQVALASAGLTKQDAEPKR